MPNLEKLSLGKIIIIQKKQTLEMGEYSIFPRENGNAFIKFLSVSDD
jgi:hypothetical protein